MFLRRARKDLEGTLARNGYHLIAEELRLVEILRRQTAGMSDEELARTLAGGLRAGLPFVRVFRFSGSSPLVGSEFLPIDTCSLYQLDSSLST